MAAGHMERNYLTLKRNYIYTALEDVEDAEWYWSPSEIKEFDWLWRKNKPLVEIAGELQRSEVAVFLLSFDRVAKGKIKARKGWKIW